MKSLCGVKVTDEDKNKSKYMVQQGYQVTPVSVLTFKKLLGLFKIERDKEDFKPTIEEWCSFFVYS